MVNYPLLCLLLWTALLVGACSDEKPSDGDIEFFISASLVPDNIIDGGQAGANGTASMALAIDNSLSGTVTLEGLASIISVALHSGFAGQQGPMLADLQRLDGNRWQLPGNLLLTSAEREQLLDGGLYLIVTSRTQPGGAVRGQLLTADTKVYPFPLEGIQIVPSTASPATARGFLSINFAARRANLHINSSNTTAFSASLNQGLAGQIGIELFALQQDNQRPAHWFAPALTLSENELSALESAQLYAVLRSTAFPAGELRGQIVPSGFAVDFTALSGAEAVFNTTVGVVTAGNGVAATTLDIARRQLDAYLNTNLTATAINASLNLAPAGINGPLAVTLNQSLTNTAQWSASGIDLSSIEFAVITAHNSYFAVGTASFPEGEIRGQWLFVEPNDGSSPEPDAVGTTLSEIQQNIFTPNCTDGGCHSGVAPAAGQNLSAGQTFSNIVSVPSAQLPAFFRISPGDPDNSYLLRKIIGTATVGSRMPLGAPALSTQDINAIRQWIADGASDN